MKLHFRGHNYETQPVSLEVTEGAVGGTYRGSAWKVHRFRFNRRHQPSQEFIYRGVTYKRG
ncbi:MAG: DUF4278 domain-containing protein [Oscillatoria sp. PMC 1051.18]|nr:DUF4278 domain-containing protein [Oscillatoria sp. PMC 1050.18]MEC5028572.1 DUF4278 domain-containing protein [Oscillatoria sp. PMC 1051.18]